MQYHKNFSSGKFFLKVHSNSQRILSFIANVLDCEKNTFPRKGQIKIDFYIQEVFPGRAAGSQYILTPRVAFNSENEIRITLKGILEIRASARKKTVWVEVAYEEKFKERLLDLFLMQPLRFIAAKDGFCFLHASAVGMGENSILVCGGQNSGKSILAASVVSGGAFRLLADDDCFLELEKGRVALSFLPTKMGLKPSALEKYPYLKKHLLKDYLYGGKSRVSALAAFGVSEDGPYYPKAVIFPEYVKNSGLEAREISADDGLDRICRQNSSFYSAQMYRQMFWVLYTLSRQARFFRLSYHDGCLFGIPEIFASI